MTISLSIIAEKAGTSKATVSRAFSRPEDVSLELRARVLKVASEMGYVHNPERSEHAKMLRPGNNKETVTRKRTNVATFLMYKSGRDHINAVPYYKKLTSVMDQTFRSEGLSLIEAYPQDEAEYLRIVESAATDGIIIMTNIHELGDDFVNLLKLHANRRPMIFLSNYPRASLNEFHCVRADGVNEGYLAARYCCRAGEGPVFFVDDGYGMAVVEDRYHGYKRALEECGRTPARLPFSADGFFQRGVSGLEGKFDPPAGPVSFVGAADSAILFFIEYLKRRRSHDPSRMRFVGIDGVPELAADDLREATVRPDFEAMARETYHLLDDALEGKLAGPKSILVGSELKKR